MRISRKQLVHDLCTALKISSLIYNSCYKLVGNHIDTIALLITPQAEVSFLPQELRTLPKMSFANKRRALQQYWQHNKKVVVPVVRSHLTGELRLVLLSVTKVANKGQLLLKFGIRANDWYVPIAELYRPVSYTELVEFEAKLSQIPGERFGNTLSLAPTFVYQVKYQGVVDAPRTKAKVKLVSIEIIKELEPMLNLVNNLSDVTEADS